jgi:hypothetical protein
MEQVCTVPGWWHQYWGFVVIGLVMSGTWVPQR